VAKKTVCLEQDGALTSVEQSPKKITAQDPENAESAQIGMV